MAIETVTADDLVNTSLPTRGWVVEDLVGVGVTLLVGSPKVGKSWLALQLANCVSRGAPLWGFATSGGTVLDLELEDNLSRIQQRLFRVSEECSDRLHIAVSAPTLADGLAGDIAAFAQKHPDTRLVIIDTLQIVRRSDQKGSYAADYRDVHAVKEVADALGVAVVLVHHQRKMDDPDPFNTVSGTNGITGAADTTMVLERKRGSSAATLRVTGRDVLERELALEFRDCRWHLTEDRTEGLEEERPVPPEVLAVVAFMEERLGWAGTATQLVSEAGLDGVAPTAIGRRLNEHSQTLLEAGIRYSARRTDRQRTIELEHV